MSNDQDFIIENGTLFQYRGKGGEVTVPDGVVRIYGRAFFRCENLTTVTLPPSTTRINARAFAGCVNLTRITLPAGLVHIGPAAFVGCDKLRKVCFQGTKAQWDAILLTTQNRPLYDADLSTITLFPLP